MNRRYVILIIAEAVVIMLLLIGVAILFVLLRRPSSLEELPVVPTFDPAFATTTPHPFVFPTSNADPSSGAPVTQTQIPTIEISGIQTASPVNKTTLDYPPTPTLFFAPTWTITPTAATAAHIAQTCRNILYPVAVGQQWLYRSSTLNRTDILNMGVTSVNNSQGVVAVNNQSSGSTKQVTVQCDGDIIRSFPSMSVDAIFVGNFIDSNLAATYVSGVLAPNEASFLNNNWALAWSSQYLVSGDTTVDRDGTQFQVSMNNSPVTLTCQTLASGDAAFETVTVPAGTFRALKVVCTEQGQVTAMIDGINVTGQVEGRSIQWFALNTGLVKMRVESANVRIFGISFSVLTENNFELLSLTQAP